jgi:hypothetical protein
MQAEDVYQFNSDQKQQRMENLIKLKVLKILYEKNKKPFIY